MLTLTAILAVVALVWFWSDSLQARERALAACRQACQQLDVQLLDQTVALSRLGLARDRRGRLQVRRLYGFEFSTEGLERRRGRAMLVGRRVDYVHLDHPGGATIVETASGAGYRVQ
jgi:hypothetical protein